MVELAILSVFPHIGPLQRWIDSLPMLEDEEEELLTERCPDILPEEEAA